jgi:hypothetical protein
VEALSFAVTLIRRSCWPSFLDSDGNQNIPYENLVENCQPTDLMKFVLNKAMTVDTNFYYGIQMRIFILTDEGKTEYIPFHPCVENMMLWELGISPNNVIIIPKDFKIRICFKFHLV